MVALGQRIINEKKAYDEEGVFERSHAIHSRFSHVFNSPNTLKGTQYCFGKICEYANNAHVLEIGSGNGEFAEEVLGAVAPASYTGVEISQTFLSEAKARGLSAEFLDQDVHKPIEGQFDFIFGRSILHHIDYQAVLINLYHNNLSPGGKMIFMEPLGISFILKLYWKLGTKYHTPDERPFKKNDLKWMNQNFNRFTLTPINYLSFPLGVMSSLVMKRPDNAIMRLGDRIDIGISKYLPFMRKRFRQGVFEISKSL